MTLTDDDFRECIKINSNYLCERSFAINRITPKVIDEIQLYLRYDRHYKHCDYKYVSSQNIIWKRLENSWLYSTPTKEVINIKCKNSPEVKETIIDTGKIVLQDDCRIITTNVVIKSQLSD